jgi:hypothetical protein
MFYSVYIDDLGCPGNGVSGLHPLLEALTRCIDVYRAFF